MIPSKEFHFVLSCEFPHDNESAAGCGEEIILVSLFAEEY
jgi:hypothetical protein